MDSTVSSRQNSPENLDCLAAQRYLYSSAKKIMGWQLFLSVPVIILISVSVLILGNPKWSNVLHLSSMDISWLVAAAGILITIFDFTLLTPMVDARKEKAAKIQELFDYSVLQITWNDVAVGDKPDSEDIHVNSECYRQKEPGGVSLKDWYSNNLDQLPIAVSRIICQRSNTRWDAELRSLYSNYIVGLAIFLLILLVFMALVEGLTLRIFFTNVLAPSLPTLVFSLRERSNNKKAIDNLTKLRKLIEDAWSGLVTTEFDENRLTERSRNIQDRIYLNRCSNLMIFDWFYNLERQTQENAMNYSIGQMVSEYESLRGTSNFPD